jgi:salicylate hydroxylase
MEELHIVIVGAGLSGLAASIQCALSGHRITVLEAARELAEASVFPKILSLHY